MPTNLQTHTSAIPTTAATSPRPRIDSPHLTESKGRAKPHIACARQALVLRVKSALQESPYFRGRVRLLKIDSPDNRTAVITGYLPSFYLKQVLQTIVQQVDGVEQVCNNVVVRDA